MPFPLEHGSFLRHELFEIPRMFVRWLGGDFSVWLWFSFRLCGRSFIPTWSWAIVPGGCPAHGPDTMVSCTVTSGLLMRCSSLFSGTVLPPFQLLQRFLTLVSASSAQPEAVPPGLYLLLLLCNSLSWQTSAVTVGLPLSVSMFSMLIHALTVVRIHYFVRSCIWQSGIDSSAVTRSRSFCAIV